MSEQARKAVILVRVSSKEQEEGHSIEAQKHRLTEYCKHKNLEIIQIFEIVESSSRGDRRKFREMLKFAKSQRECIAVVADKVDRIQRKISEVALLEEPIKAGKIELHFRTENYIIHKDSRSHERLMWGMGALTAQAYVDNLSDNVKRSIEHKLRKGEWIGPAPLGYLNAKNEAGKSIVILDPVRAPVIKKIFEDYATGTYTIGKLVKYAKDKGLRTRKGFHVSKSTLYDLLRNSFYYGEMKVKGDLISHCHGGIITIETFKECEKVRLGWDKKQFKYGAKEFLFKGLLTCAVTGRVVTAQTKKKTYATGKTDEWTYLATWNPEDLTKLIYVREDDVIKQVEAVLAKIGIQDEELLKDVLSPSKKYKHSQKRISRCRNGSFEEGAYRY